MSEKVAPGRAGGAAKPRRGEVGDEELMERLRLEHAEVHPRVGRGESCGISARKASRKRFGAAVRIEYRTGSGTTVRECVRCRGFGDTPGVIRQSTGSCNPAIHRCMDRFYGQIDRDLDEWQFREDLKLRVPYAVKAWKHHKRHMAILRRDARRRGLV